MRPMMFAHTTVELPKYGASSREAAISVESVPAPAAKTTPPSRQGAHARMGAEKRVLGLQQVEAPEIVLDRQHLTGRKAGLVCITLDGCCADHRAGSDRAFPNHADGQAVEDTEAVVEPLHFTRRGRERILGALVADEHDAAVGEEASCCAKDAHGIRHVVQRLEDRDEVVAAGQLGVGGIALMERHAALDSA